MRHLTEVIGVGTQFIFLFLSTYFSVGFLLHSVLQVHRLRLQSTKEGLDWIQQKCKYLGIHIFCFFLCFIPTCASCVLTPAALLGLNVIRRALKTWRFINAFFRNSVSIILETLLLLFYNRDRDITW